jgi:hypothetical protein
VAHSLDGSEASSAAEVTTDVALELNVSFRGTAEVAGQTKLGVSQNNVARERAEEFHLVTKWKGTSKITAAPYGTAAE